MAVRSCFLSLVLAGVGANCLAQSGGPQFSGSLGLAHRTLTETTAAGDTLLTERGLMPQLQLAAEQLLAAGGALAGRARVAGGDLDYRGQTQAGMPLSTTTGQSEVVAELLWRPRAPAAWGEAWLSIGWLGNRRAIHSTPNARGLDERSTAWMGGLQWRSPAFGAVDGWTARVEAEAGVSLRHRLQVDYLGLLDPSTLDGGRRRQVALRLVAVPGTQSPWCWSLEWARLSQGASGSAPVTRGGAPFGSVRQPALTAEDLALRLTRRF